MVYEGCKALDGVCHYQSSPIAKRRLLVVDDDTADLELAVDGFERNGFEVETFQVYTDRDLPGLAQEIAAGKYDLILSDTMAGLLYGPTDIVPAIRSSGIDIPYVGWSGALSNEHETNWRTAGAQDVVVKPTDGMQGYQHLGDRIKGILSCHCKKER